MFFFLSRFPPWIPSTPYPIRDTSFSSWSREKDCSRAIPDCFWTSLISPATRTPPQPVDPAAPPWLLAPSSPPWPVSPLAPLGSLVPPALPWSVVVHSVASGLHSSRCASSLWLRQAPHSLRLLLGPLSLRLHLCLPDPRLSHLFHLGPPDPPCHPGSSALRLCLGLLRSKGLYGSLRLTMLFGNVALDCSVFHRSHWLVEKRNPNNFSYCISESRFSLSYKINLPCTGCHQHRIWQRW